jgi:kumamolisin
VSSRPITHRAPRRIVASLVGLLAGVLVVAGMPASAQAPGAVSTGSIAAEVPAPVNLGPLGPSEPVAFELVLAARDPEASSRFAAAVNDPTAPEYRHFLTPQQIGERFGPTDETLARVREVLDVAGIQPVSMPPQRTRLSVTGPAAAVGAFLGVPIERWQDPRSGMTYPATSTSPAVPAALDGVVSAVSGLSPWLPISYIDPADAPPIPDRGLTPQDLARAYDYESLWAEGIDGTGTSVGILQFGLDTDEDLAVFDATFGLTGPTPKRVPVNGGLSPDAPEGFAGEATLDTQVVRAVAPGTQIIVYGFPARGTSFGSAMDAIVAAGETQFVSLSFGRCYAGPYVSLEMVEDLHRGLEAAAQAGVTLMVASGDDGAFACHPFDLTDHRITTDFPSCSEHALSVGGTMLELNDDGSYRRETGWEDFLATKGTGGGINAISDPDGNPLEPKPAYQQGVDGIDPGLDYRHCPDVSAVADSTTGYLIFQTDPATGEAAWQVTGGTSASAPFWAAAMALIQQKAQAAGVERIGFLNDLLYGIKASHPEAFHDIVRGGNLQHDSGPGWDAATGIGSPVVSVLADAVVETLGG